jgi:hypothetical protein
VKLPWDKKPVVNNKKRLISSSAIVDKKKISIPKIKGATGVVTGIGSGLYNIISPFTSIIVNDWKRLFGIDDETKKKKMEYDDFMENHFGVKR